MCNLDQEIYAQYWIITYSVLTHITEGHLAFLFHPTSANSQPNILLIYQLNGETISMGNISKFSEQIYIAVLRSVDWVTYKLKYYKMRF